MTDFLTLDRILGALLIWLLFPTLNAIKTGNLPKPQATAARFGSHALASQICVTWQTAPIGILGQLWARIEVKSLPHGELESSRFGQKIKCLLIQGHPHADESTLWVRIYFPLFHWRLFASDYLILLMKEGDMASREIEKWRRPIKYYDEDESGDPTASGKERS